MFVGYGIAIVVYAIEGDMHVRMFLVEMPCYKELSVPYAHPFHIFKSDTSHSTIRQTWLILFGETQRDMSYRLRHPVVHPRLGIETHGNGFPVLHEQTLVCDNLGILVLVKDIIHHTLKVASLYDFRHHIPILINSS